MSHFSYLGNDTGYDKKYDTDTELGKLHGQSCMIMEQSVTLLGTRYMLRNKIKSLTKLWQSLYCLMGVNYGQLRNEYIESGLRNGIIKGS